MAKRMTKTEKERIGKVLDLFDEYYSTEYVCYLNHENAWQLLIATILSAQCTDERVNIVTKDLFKKYRSIEDFAKADLKELEKDIHSTGFYRNKAKNIIECANRLLLEYHGEVPKEMDELITLAGVGRKTANVIRGNIYHEPSIVVDTHVKRISKKLGFTDLEDPEKIEFELMKVLPKEHWILYNIQVIAHGRSICVARSPKCEECFLNGLCKDYQDKLNPKKTKTSSKAKEEKTKVEKTKEVKTKEVKTKVEKTNEAKTKEVKTIETKEIKTN